MPSLASPALKPLDLVVSIYLAVNETSGYQQLAKALHASIGSVHAAVKRARLAQLITADNAVVRANLLEFLVHGVRYTFYAERGPAMRGVPTGAAAPGISEYLTSTSENSPVWPSASGSRRGHSLTPMLSTVPDIALRDPTLHTAFGAVDLIRIGSARERAVAGEVLARLLER